MECPVHGVRQIVVPWAEPGWGFTPLLEALGIDWLREAPFSAVARRTVSRVCLTQDWPIPSGRPARIAPGFDSGRARPL